MGCGCKNKGQAQQPQTQTQTQQQGSNHNPNAKKSNVQESVKKLIQKYYRNNICCVKNYRCS
jgi:hypothetical protein